MCEHTGFETCLQPLVSLDLVEWLQELEVPGLIVHESMKLIECRDPRNRDDFVPQFQLKCFCHFGLLSDTMLCVVSVPLSTIAYPSIYVNKASISALISVPSALPASSLMTMPTSFPALF